MQMPLLSAHLRKDRSTTKAVTNLLGFVLMHKGAQKMIADSDRKYSWRDLVRDVGVSLLYTALIVALIKFGVLKPIQSYFAK